MCKPTLFRNMQPFWPWDYISAPTCSLLNEQRKVIYELLSRCWIKVWPWRRDILLSVMFYHLYNFIMSDIYAMYGQRSNTYSRLNVCRNVPCKSSLSLREKRQYMSKIQDSKNNNIIKIAPSSIYSNWPEEISRSSDDFCRGPAFAMNQDLV